MAKQRVFGGVTESVWTCLKTSSEKEHGTIYAPPGANQGTSTTKTVVGTVVLGFDFMPEKESIRYTIKQKPLLVPTGQIWSGIQEAIDDCQAK